MHAALEYLAVGLLLVIVILAAGQMIEAPARTVETVKAEQLYTVAERLIDKILLTPGYPENWGADLLLDHEVMDFGLALAGAKTPYIVDPDKVMRLANLTTYPNPVPISAERIAELLGIKGEYGFRLEMKPMIRIRVEALDVNDGLPSTFIVNVVNWQGIALPNARVTGIYVIVYVPVGVGAGQENKQDRAESENPLVESCLTDSLGTCTLRFTIPVLKPKGGMSPVPFIVLHVNWEGFVCISGYSPTPRASGDSPVNAYIVGNTIIVEGIDEIRGVFKVDDEVVQVVPQYGILIKDTDVEWCRAQPGGRVEPEDNIWCHRVAGRILPARRKEGVDYLLGRVYSLERLSSHIIVTGVWTKGGPASEKGVAIVISRIPEVDISWGAENAQPANAVTITRIAQIYNYPYIVRLTIWRLVEGWP
ncbi:MAG: hypothetical protein QW189_07220 [Thermofilaceae archaeon]